MLGLGGVGSAAAYQLSRRGYRVLGIDPNPPGHDRGSSHGQTRIIRQAYFEHPHYVPLLRDAYDLWHQLETEAETKLFHRTGLLQIGPTDGVVVLGVLRSAELHSLPIETLGANELRQRFPQVRTEDHWVAVLEHNAGYLRVEACVLAHLQLANRQGASLRHGDRVIQWHVDGDGVVVETTKGIERAARLVIAAGPWAGSVLAGCGAQLEVLRKHMYWYEPAENGYGEQDGMPCFFYETKHGYFYGFPARDHRGLKVARHSGGQRIKSFGERSPEPSIDGEDRKLVELFLRNHLPGVGNVFHEQQSCFYTMTTDENFIVDTLPNCPQVVVIAGLSGHGFKFTSVLGKIACELAMDGITKRDIDFLRWR